MKTSEIRESIHYQTFIEHSLSIKFAADENLKLSEMNMENFDSENDRIKALGLYRSTLLLYAISVELILKAKGLYNEIQNIKNGSIKNFEDFLNRLKGNGHIFNEIIKKYEIILTKEEHDLINNLQPYAIWDGRFPFPRKDSMIKEYENNKMEHGIITSDLNIRIESLIEKQISEMK